MRAHNRVRRIGYHVVVMLGLVWISLQTAHAAPAAHVDFALGEVFATDLGGSKRALRKGDSLNQGDTITTGDGLAHIRFSDGSYVSLRHNSEFRIEAYAFTGRGDGSEKGFFRLLRGGLRTITGLIGRHQRTNYRVSTPVATIGIRGTGYTLEMEDDVMFLSVGEGCATSRSGGSTSVICYHEACRVDGLGASCEKLREKKPLSAPEEEEYQYSKDEDRDEEGDQTVVQLPPAEETPPQEMPPQEMPPQEMPPAPVPPAPPALTSGSGFTLAFAVGETAEGPSGKAGVGSDVPVNATFVDSKLTNYAGTTSGNVGAGTTIVDSGFDTVNGTAVIGWGRWQGGTSSGSHPHPLNLDPGSSNNQSFHYVVGIPTPALPAGSARYSTVVGATSPAFDNGRMGTLDSASFTANFDMATVSGNMAVSFPGDTYNLISDPMPITGAQFSGSGTATAATDCVSGGCPASFTGFFAGDGAARLGVAYDVSTFGNGVFGGAAVLSKDATPPAIAQ